MTRSTITIAITVTLTRKRASARLEPSEELRALPLRDQWRALRAATLEAYAETGSRALAGYLGAEVAVRR